MVLSDCSGAGIRSGCSRPSDIDGRPTLNATVASSPGRLPSTAGARSASLVIRVILRSETCGSLERLRDREVQHRRAERRPSIALRDHRRISDPLPLPPGWAGIYRVPIPPSAGPPALLRHEPDPNAEREEHARGSCPAAAPARRVGQSRTSSPGCGPKARGEQLPPR
jgi:hypothetical protein